MEFKVSVCPHELERKFIWEKFFKNLSNFLKIDLVFIPVLNFQEELEKIQKEEFSLFYASPSTAYLFYKKGYIPIAKFKDQIDKFLIVGSESLEKIEKKEFIRIATINKSFYVLPLGYFSYKYNFSFHKLHMVLTFSHKETLQKIINGEAEVGIIYEEFFKVIEEREKLRIYEEFTLETNHVFMLNPQKISKEKIREALHKVDLKVIEELGYKEIEIFEDKEMEKVEKLFLISELNFELLKGKTFQEVLMKSPYIGVLIYHDKYIYANPYMCKLLGYSLEEFCKLKPEEIHYFEEDRKRIREIVRRRLKGEYFLQTYEEMVLKTKNDTKVYIVAFSETIFYDGKFCGLVFIIDISKEKRLEILYKIISKINQILIEVNSEKELFKKICKVLVEDFGLKMVWVGIPDYKEKLIKPLYAYGEEKGYLKEIKVYMEETKAEGRGPVGTSFREDKITIISDTETDERFLPWKESALKRGYYSVAAIPLKVNEKVSYVLALYSDESFFFKEEHEQILEELKRDLEFGLAKIDLLRKETILAESLRNLEEVVMVLDQEGKIIFINEKGCEILRCVEKEICGNSIGIFNFKFKEESLENIFKIGIKNSLRIPVKLVKDEEVNWFDMKIIPIKLPEGIFRYVIIAEDISQILQFGELLDKARYIDSLTQHFNYEGFLKRVNEILPFLSDFAYLIIVDLCNFTYINTNFGYEAGNFCLEEIGRRFLTFKNYVIISRPFSDSFALFFYNIKEKDQVVNTLEELKKLIYAPITLKDQNINFYFNAGVAIFPDDGKTFKDLWEKASIALNEARGKEPGVIEFYNSIMDEKIKRYFQCEALIRKAFEQNLFVFYYQPYFDSSQLKVIGLEVLVRIKEKNGKLYFPSEFIEYLENSPYLEKFEEWGIKEVKEKISKWKLPISFNVSINSIIRSDFLSKILKIFENKDLDNLILEVTERIFVKDIEVIKKSISEIKRQGIKIALDDFGIGYSSLSYLKEISFDILKIDKAFIKDMVKGKKEAGLVKTFIDIGHTFDMKVLAEGVETKDQANFLDIMGCDYLQGFYLAKPMSEEEIEEFLKKGNEK